MMEMFHGVFIMENPAILACKGDPDVYVSNPVRKKNPGKNGMVELESTDGFHGVPFVARLGPDHWVGAAHHII